MSEQKPSKQSESSDNLLSEDEQPIRPVPDKVRKAWEPKPSGYVQADYERDQAARQRTKGDPGK